MSDVSHLKKTSSGTTRDEDCTSTPSHSLHFQLDLHAALMWVCWKLVDLDVVTRHVFVLRLLLYFTFLLLFTIKDCNWPQLSSPRRFCSSRCELSVSVERTLEPREWTQSRRSIPQLSPWHCWLSFPPRVGCSFVAFRHLWT